MKRLWLLALVVGIAAAVLFLWDLPREGRQVDTELSSLRLTTLDPELVDTLRIVQGPQRLELVRRDKGWWITQPIAERADDTSVRGIIAGLCRAQSLRVVASDVDSTALDAFGLGGLHPPQHWIELSAPGREALIYDLGRSNPTGDAIYLRVRGRASVLLASPSVGELGRTSYQAFRIYDLFDLEKEDISRLAIQNALGSFSVVRSDRGLWFTQEDPPRQVRRKAIDFICYDLARSRIRRFVADDLEENEFAGLGLHQPILHVEFEAGGRARSLSVGNESEEQFLHFARRDSQSVALIISGELVESSELALDSILETNPVPDNYALLDSIRVIWHSGETITALPRNRNEWDYRAPPGWEGDPDHFLISANNLSTGVEDLASDLSVELVDPAAADEYLTTRPVACELHWPDRSVIYEIGWRRGEDAHWLQIVGEARVHRIPRDLYFRLRGALLTADLIDPGS